MAGRKASVDPSRIINAVLHFKNRVVEEKNGEKSKYIICY